MSDSYLKLEITKKYILVFGLAVLLSWILHEFAHWTMGEYLGYTMGMTLNSSYPVNGSFLKDSHYQMVSAAGPVFTLLEAILMYVLMVQRTRLLLYPFLFTCFYMRFFAMLISFRKPNDEARISIAMGFGKFTLPLIMATVLFLIIYKVNKKYSFDKKFNFANLGLVILFSSVIILADMYLKVRLL